VGSGDTAASCMMDLPFDVDASIRRLIRILADAYEARLDGT